DWWRIGSGVVLSDLEDEEEWKQKGLQVESLNEKLNKVTLEFGRLPQKKGECLMDSEYMASAGYEIGDEITLREGSDSELLKVHTYKIVGSGNSPLYISFSRGNTNLGSGEVSGFLYVEAQNFNQDAYTQAYLRVENAKEQISFTDAYNDLV